MRPAHPTFAVVLALLLGARALAAQGGQATLAVQGYYLRTGSELAAETTGTQLTFEEFLPRIGLIRARLEAYRSDGGLQPADNYLQLRGLVWQGLRWNFSGGDFRAPASLLPNPFSNIFFPEINARGFAAEAGNERRSYSLFYGSETVLAGPRIPFRVDVPQKAMGVSMRQKFGRFETGVRLLRLTNTPHDASQDSFFPAGSDFHSAENLTVYSAYRLDEHLRWYGEATLGQTEPATARLSYFFGPAWESPRFTVKLNYAQLSRSYMPLAGYWVGDRKGPFGEIRVRPVRRVELSGSASRYESASKGDSLPALRSSGASGGLSLELPWQWSASVQLSLTDFHSSDPSAESVQNATNRQWTGTLSRRFGSQTVRLTGRDMRLTANEVVSRQRSVEVEDMFHIRRVVMGAGVRAQQSSGPDLRNAVYAHGSVQLNLGRLTAAAFYEGGKDLINHTVFATSATNSASVSANVRMTRHWSVAGEAFRSRLVSEVNPQSAFVVANQNFLLNPLLNQFHQWSFLFRVERTFSWGGAMPAVGLDQFTAQRIPITGTVEGVVYVLAAGGRQPAADVVVSLESGRSVVTDGEGHYRLAEVPEGAHVVSLDLERLPADYNAGPVRKIAAAIGPRKVARADFELYSLGGFTGKVVATAGSEYEDLGGIVIRLEPGGRYTITAKDGGFAFYNLPEGSYRATIAADTLPPAGRVKGDAVVPVEIRTGSEAPAVRFEIDRPAIEQKPVRKVLDKVLGTVQ